MEQGEHNPKSQGFSSLHWTGQNSLEKLVVEIGAFLRRRDQKSPRRLKAAEVPILSFPPLPY